MFPNQPKPQPKPQALCNYFRTNGEQCLGVAVTNERYCYFHLRDRQRAAVIDRAYIARAKRILNNGPANEIHTSHAFTRELFNETSASLVHSLEIPVLEDANAIQITITNLLRAVGAGLIDLRAASIMLYGLQTAATLLPRLRTVPFKSDPQATKAPDPLTLVASAVAELQARKKAAADAAYDSKQPAKSETDIKETSDALTGTDV